MHISVVDSVDIDYTKSHNKYTQHGDLVQSIIGLGDLDAQNMNQNVVFFACSPHAPSVDIQRDTGSRAVKGRVCHNERHHGHELACRGGVLLATLWECTWSNSSI
jgi:hypothetical protein